MGYKLSSFDSLAIPNVAPSFDIGSGEASSPLLTIPGGGVYDPLSTDTARRGAVRLSCAFTLQATSGSLLQDAYDLWLAKVGKRGTLYRVGDDGAGHYVTARLTEVRATRRPANRLNLPVSLQFEAWDYPWAGTPQQAPSYTLSGATVTCNVVNSGNARTVPALLSIKASGASITGLSVTVAGTSQFTYSGTIASGQSLLVYAQQQRVTYGGAGVYSAFSLTASHAIDDWLEFQPGTTAVVIVNTGGGTAGTAQIYYNHSWA